MYCRDCSYVVDVTISHFVELGKATMMRRFIENAWFITGTREFPGTLADTSPGMKEIGFLSFVTLICTVYFKKHLAEFSHTTHRALYTSITHQGIDHVQQHKHFIGASLSEPHLFRTTI